MLKTYSGGTVSREVLEEALDFLISLETDENDIDSNAYEKNIENAGENYLKAKTVIRNFGEQIAPRTLKNMQNVYYSFTNSLKYRANAITLSVATSSLNAGWHGIGEWRQ
jgi:hypothetical protein